MQYWKRINKEKAMTQKELIYFYNTMHTSVSNSEGRNNGSVQLNINYSIYNNEWLNILNNKI